jgi:Spy/CpxP family protein refolding chaperone
LPNMSTMLMGWLMLAMVAPDLAAAEQTPAPRPKWWQSADCRAAVGITDQQSASIERIFQSVLPELRAEKAELERQETALARLLKDESAGEAVVIRTIDRVEAARSALAKTRTLMLYRMHRVLSPEQRVRLDTYHQNQEREAAAARQKTQS